MLQTATNVGVPSRKWLKNIKNVEVNKFVKRSLGKIRGFDLFEFLTFRTLARPISFSFFMLTVCVLNE